MATRRNTDSGRPRSRTSPAAKKATKKRTANPKTRKGKAELTKTNKARVLRERAMKKPNVPLLELLEPSLDDYGPGWSERLRFILDRTDITADILADRMGVNRAAVYQWVAGERGSDIGQQRIVQLSEALGIHPESWHWDMAEFAAMIRHRYPGYGYHWNRTTEDKNNAYRPYSYWNTADDGTVSADAIVVAA